MPTVVTRPANQPLEPHFLLDWDAGRDASEKRAAVAGTALVHAVLLAWLLLAPAEPTVHRTARPAPRMTPLAAPPLVLTQKAPNPFRPAATVTLDALQAPRPAQIKSPPPFTPPVAAPAPAPAPAPKLVAELPPGLEPAPATSKPAGILNNLPQPVAPSPEQPKLTLETPSAPKPAARLAVPGAAVDQAIRNLAHSGGGSNMVGDIVPDIYSSRSPSPGPPRAAVGLKSDPMGVDFRPYLQQVLQAVKRNWFAVMPESARLGQRGQVVLVFGVNKAGKITKIVFSTESGAQPLDRAAVAALSASDPLPPLPTDYKGATVALQFTFQYNAPPH